MIECLDFPEPDIRQAVAPFHPASWGLPALRGGSWRPIERCFDAVQDCAPTHLGRVRAGFVQGWFPPPLDLGELVLVCVPLSHRAAMFGGIGA